MNHLYRATDKTNYTLDILNEVNGVIFFNITFKNGSIKKSSIKRSLVSEAGNYNSKCGGYIYGSKEEAVLKTTLMINYKIAYLIDNFDKTLKVYNKQLANL